MNKLIVIGIIALVLIGGVFTVRMFSDEDSWLCDNGIWVKHGNPSAGVPERACGAFWFEGAKRLAEGRAGEINASLTGNYEYNDYTKTVWFEIDNAESIKSGCNPASVVNIESGESEINWRCTGLIVPESG